MAQPEVLAQRRPHAVGADRVAGVDRAERRRRRARRGRPWPVARRRRAWPSCTLTPGRRGPGRRARRRARAAGRRRRSWPWPAGSGNSTTRPGRRAHPGGVDLGPRRHDRRVEAELLEQAQGAGGQAVAAALVPREARLVDEHHVEPGAGGGDGGGHPGRAGADDGDVGVGSVDAGLRARPHRQGRHPHGLVVRAAVRGRRRRPHCWRCAVTWAGSWLRTTG